MSFSLQNILRDNKYYNLYLWLIFAIGLVTYKFAFHELWKDEWQAWLVARDLNLLDMLSFLNYEGHPSLWYLYLKVWSYLPLPDLISLQLSHSVLVVATLYYLFVKISFPTLWKFMIAMSYFLVFEYGVINRGYILVILLSFIAVHLIVNKNTFLEIGVVLFLLCQTEAYGVLIAAALTVYLLLNVDGKNITLNQTIIAWAVTGFLFFVFTVYPRGNNDDFTRAYNQQLFSGEVIHESIQGHLANVFTIGIIDDTAISGNSTIGITFSIIILLILGWIFLRDRRILISFLLGLFSLIAFGILIFSGGVRQWGIVFVLYILMLMLTHQRNSKWNLTRSLLVTLLMIAPMIHGIRAIVIDARIPFSNAEEVGLFIKENVPKNVPVLAINKFETAPVGAYADRPLYELPSGEEFTYFKWLEKVYIPTQSEISLFTKFKNVGGIVLLSPEPIDNNRFPNAKLWQEFNSENFKRESYWLYSVALTD